jgi:hypothetical protein
VIGDGYDEESQQARFRAQGALSGGSNVGRWLISLEEADDRL